MLRKMKFGVLSGIATLAVFVGVLGIQPACFATWYQPEVPEHLKDC